MTVALKKVDWTLFWLLFVASFETGLVAGSMVQVVSSSPIACTATFLVANPIAWIFLKWLIRDRWTPTARTTTSIVRNLSTG